MTTETMTQTTTQAPKKGRFDGVGREIMMSQFPVVLGAFVLAIVAGSLLIVFTNADVQAAAGYFFAKPQDMLSAAGNAISEAYSALFRGAIYDYTKPTFEQGIASLMNSLHEATPLIAAGLGVGLAFRVGMFNIGGQGQILLAAAGAGWVATRMELPAGIHLIVALVVGIAFGALWAGIAGILKARTGAHEVIVTIMLNHVARYLLLFALGTQWLLQAIGSSNVKSGYMAETAVLPKLFGDQYRVTVGLLIAIAAVFFVWWLLEKSSLGFRMRVVGQNPAAARTAGINVGRMYFLGMLIAGALVGIAGVTLALSSKAPFGDGVDAGIGFDAITVALLGGSTPFGILAAGLLFGMFQAGSVTMKIAQVPAELVDIVLALIVLFIAAPPLVRAIFGLPKPGKPSRKERKARKSAAADRASLVAAAAGTVTAVTTETLVTDAAGSEVVTDVAVEITPEVIAEDAADAQVLTDLAEGNVEPVESDAVGVDPIDEEGSEK
ncbi:hypothetical protein GCM10009860_07770 [Microbacterium mitrae]|nr:ABC transporter permease [Microbacterium mitrae]